MFFKKKYYGLEGAGLGGVAFCILALIASIILYLIDMNEENKLKIKVRYFV